MKNVVITPAGVFFAVWDDDDEFGDSPPIYEGDSAAIDFFRAYLEINYVTGPCGHSINFSTLQPNTLYDFCQHRELGIIVLPEPMLVFDELLDDFGESDSLRQFLANKVNENQIYDRIEEGQHILEELDVDSPLFDIKLSRLHEIIAWLESLSIQFEEDEN